MSIADPFHNRQEERELYHPLIGDSMLELGNKNNKGRPYKPFFESKGYRHVSVDINGKDGALVRDLTEPLDLGEFDMVTNIGTTEHVGSTWEEQENCWINILNAMHVGSVLLSVTPAPGGWPGHGTWYPPPEFFENLAKQNGLEVERLFMHEDRRGDLLYGRFRRTENILPDIPRIL